MTLELPLPAQLSQALVAFTIEFDNEFECRMPHRTTQHGSTPGLDHPPYLVSMAMWVNCMRFVPEEGITGRVLASRAQVTGKSMQGVLTRMSEWWGRPKLARLTAKGRQAQDTYLRWSAGIGQRWDERFGAEAMRALQVSAVQIAGEPSEGKSPLHRGLEPYPGGWRAAVPPPQTLPHFPVISARGGFPDGN